MRKTDRLIRVGVVLSAFLPTTACAASNLAGSEWRPTEIGGVTIPADAEMFVQFGGEGRLQGHGGCNGFFGSYKLTADKIEIGPLGATQMACAEPVMDRELLFFQALGNAKSFVRDGINLSLTDATSGSAARLIQTDAD